VKFGIFIYDGVEPIDLATSACCRWRARIAPEITDLHHRTPRRTGRPRQRIEGDSGFRHRRMRPACDLVIVTRRAKLDRAGAGSATLRLHQARPMLRIGLHRYVRRHDPGRERRAGRRSCHHQARGGSAGNLRRSSDARELSAIDVREAMLVERDGGVVTGGGVTLCNRHHASSSRQYARPARRPMKPRASWNIKRPGRANREALRGPSTRDSVASQIFQILVFTIAPDRP